MTQGTHEFVDDPRNRDIRIYVNGEMKPRAEATVAHELTTMTGGSVSEVGDRPTPSSEYFARVPGLAYAPPKDLVSRST